MKILQISTNDLGGGAERIAYELYEGYRRRGHASYLGVGTKRDAGVDGGIFAISGPDAQGAWRRYWTGMQSGFQTRGQAGAARMALRLANLGEPRTWVERHLGVENFNFPGSRRLLVSAPAQPDILHAHNLHGGYFDLRQLPVLAKQAPLFLTLHDSWLLSGHCSYSLGCQRWRTGCGRCPDLTLPVPVRRDATAYNWRRKRGIYARSRLFVATPSQWLMDMVQASILAPAIAGARVINNGVDLHQFRPGDKLAARQALGLPTDRPIGLFVAVAARRHRAKDYPTLEAAIRQVAARPESSTMLFICLGDTGEEVKLAAGSSIRFGGFVQDRQVLATYYQAADFYLHATKADTFPTTVLEALACGLPVVATAVGGIPEQLEEGRTGFLAAPGDPASMAAGIANLIDHPELVQTMSEAAANTARSRFDADRMIDDYLTWYEQILAAPRSSSS